MAGLLSKYAGRNLNADRTVMNRTLLDDGPKPEDDAIGPPSILGGLLSLDPTDYIGPQTLAKLGVAAKAALGPALLGGLMATGKGSIPSRMRQSGQVVWHGSPHKFSKFDMSKIGTGEGAQAYGHGLYMAESPSVAQDYQKRLSDAGADYTFNWRGNQYPAKSGPEAHAISLAYHDSPKMAKSIGKEGLAAAKKGEPWAIEMGGVDYWQKMLDTASQIKGKKEISGVQGQLYKVDIPDEAVARFLDWDKPLSQQAPEVQKAFGSIVDRNIAEESGWAALTGREALNAAAERAGLIGKGGGEDLLKKAGIPGIRYLDGGSRSAGQGSSNFVLFQDDMPRILEINGVPTGNAPWQPGEWRGLLGN